MRDAEPVIEPSMLSERLRLRKLEICACLKPVRSASFRPVTSPASMRFHSALRKFSCSVLTFIREVYHLDISVQV